jgi:hypothetical protein
MRPAARGVLICVAILLTAALLTLALRLKGQPIEEGRCRLVTRKTNRDLLGLAYQTLQPQASRPEAIVDLPAGFAKPTYYLIKSGDRQIAAALDLSKGLRLCVDTDGDASLARERCFAAKCISNSKEGGIWRFGPVELNRPTGQGQASYELYAYCYSPDTPGQIVLCPASCKTGALRLQGRVYQVAVTDGDYDGRFSTAVRLPLGEDWRMPGCDVLGIDFNHDGGFSLSPYLKPEVWPLGRMVLVGGSYYAIDMPADGSSLALSKVEPQLGTLILEPNDITASLRLWSDAADQNLPDDYEWQLPAGRYKAIYATLRKTDPAGDVWTFNGDTRVDSAQGYVRLGPLDSFEIRPGESTTLRLGPPFAIKTRVEKTGSGPVRIEAILTDSGGAEYRMDFRRNGEPPAERPFKIVDEKGTVLVEDAFKCRGDNIYPYSWQVPEGFKGKVQVRVDLDLRPLEVRQDETWHPID